MARDKTIKILRTTRANLDTQKTASGLLAGEPYLITDEDRLSVGTAVNNYSDMAKKSEVDAKKTDNVSATSRVLGRKTAGAGLIEELTIGEALAFAGIANLVPTMTSNTAPSGVASASSIYSSSYDAWYAFNHNTSDAWVNNLDGANNFPSVPQWIQYKFTLGKIINKYTIYPRASNNNQAPSAWELRGSNDGSTWITLDSRSGITFSGDVAQIFTFVNFYPYLYYRLYMTAGGSSNAVSIGELELWGTETLYSGTGGSAPTTVVRTSNFTTTSSSYVDVTGMEFTVNANKKYFIHGMIILSGDPNNHKVGFTFPSGSAYFTVKRDGVQNAETTMAPSYGSYTSGNDLLLTWHENTQAYPFTLFLDIGSTGGTVKMQLKSQNGTATIYNGTAMILQETL